jgi:hypothetical protein
MPAKGPLLMMSLAVTVLLSAREPMMETPSPSSLPVSDSEKLSRMVRFDTVLLVAAARMLSMRTPASKWSICPPATLLVTTTRLLPAILTPTPGPSASPDVPNRR